MELEEFENLIAGAVGELPAGIREKLDNVDVVVEEGESPNNSLFGLYHGVSQLKRGSSYGMGMVLPDKITIWKGTIEKYALRQAQDQSTLQQTYDGYTASEDPARITSLVRRVVWHEIGHHFGFDEEQIRKLEEKWERERKV